MEKCILTLKKYWQPMSVNLPQRGLSKTAKATGDLVGNKITEKITNAASNS